MIDLRSDTFTKPSAEMLQYMLDAKVGDDVFGEDPSVNELQKQCAFIFGMEAALYCPTGTMTNQIAIKCHTQPGDEVICEKMSHVYIYEGGGIAFNSGCQVKAIEGVRGMITAKDVSQNINPYDVHKANTSLVCLENTTNRGGGACYDFEEIVKIKEVCTNNNLKLHLDGARLFNALVAKNDSPSKYGEVFDSISICFSKGLGTPIGSVLTGNTEFINKAKRIRKVLGGGMRQAGYMAAAGIYALHNNVHRLKEDHKNAKRIAEALLEKDIIGKMMPVETNIIIFEVLGENAPVHFCEKMKENDILCLPISNTQVRMVTHLDITNEMVDKLITLINDL